MQRKRRKPRSPQKAPTQPASEGAVSQIKHSRPPPSTATDFPDAGLARQILRHLPDGWGAILDCNFRYLLVEGPGLTKLGLSPAQLVGKTVDEALPPEIAEQVKPHFLRAFAGEEVSFELSFGEQTFFLEASLFQETPYPAKAILIMAHNITSTRSLQASLLAATQTARSEAQKERESFIALVAHDLRTPLTVISGLVQMLERSTMDDTKRAETQRKLREQTKRMQRLIDDLLDPPRDAE